VCTHLLSHACYMPCLYHPPSRGYSSYIFGVYNLVRLS
jgi:hypothetical protein